MFYDLFTTPCTLSAVKQDPRNIWKTNNYFSKKVTKLKVKQF